MTARLYVAAVLGGVVVVALALGWVLVFGRFDPSPPSLLDDPAPDIPGEILYIDNEGCIVAIRASGEDRRELTCPLDLNQATWLTDGRVLYAVFSRAPGPDWYVYDPETDETEQVDSEQTPFEVFEPFQDALPDGRRVTTNPDGDIVIVEDGTPRILLEFDGPEGYAPSFAAASPDSRYTAWTYFREEEIWIVPVDGSEAGTLATDARAGGFSVSWRLDDGSVSPPMRRTVGGLR